MTHPQIRYADMLICISRASSAAEALRDAIQSELRVGQSQEHRLDAMWHASRLAQACDAALSEPPPIDELARRRLA
jgi:hypothetical protein